ncbi:hypothetical protein PMI18_01508 [Pseudomonas sp. GM102]|uniref:hypothetical protein n=1 Tax=Pseudomonas sp. GM102 TaxID=1144321 RepID=UPI00026FA37C|nr:hypothetical protein [Pseudomonas sp. GM102]EJM03812.1 hypothetical protein PMI18_01508 [Pseudomonas sp. GM102]
MKALCYKNTATNLRGWIEALHEKQVYGFAYELPDHFVHIYGTAGPLYVISSGLTVIEEKNGSLRDWVVSTFGATDIRSTTNDVGSTVTGIWRPGLYFQNEIYQGLDIDQYEQRFSEQSLRVLIEQLDVLLLYIEPEGSGLSSYSHKTRELLILACTEVESHWKSLLTKAGAAPLNGRTFTTNDYVKLLSSAHLREYTVLLRNYRTAQPVSPFANWTATAPTNSLAWYDAYNKTKHDRGAHFNEATLSNVISAVSACITLFCVRFGPFHLVNESKTLSSIFNQNFEISLNEPDIKSFYVPLYNFSPGTRRDRTVVNPYNENLNLPWQPQILAI